MFSFVKNILSIFFFSFTLLDQPSLLHPMVVLIFFPHPFIVMKNYVTFSYLEALLHLSSVVFSILCCCSLSVYQISSLSILSHAKRFKDTAVPFFFFSIFQNQLICCVTYEVGYNFKIKSFGIKQTSIQIPTQRHTTCVHFGNLPLKLSQRISIFICKIVVIIASF